MVVRFVWEGRRGDSPCSCVRSNLAGVSPGSCFRTNLAGVSPCSLSAWSCVLTYLAGNVYPLVMCTHESRRGFPWSCVRRILQGVRLAHIEARISQGLLLGCVYSRISQGFPLIPFVRAYAYSKRLRSVRPFAVSATLSDPVGAILYTFSFIYFLPGVPASSIEKRKEEEKRARLSSTAILFKPGTAKNRKTAILLFFVLIVAAKQSQK